MNNYIVNNPVSFLKMKPKIYLSFVLLIILLVIIYVLNQQVSSTINIQGVVYKEGEYQVILFVPYNQMLMITNNNKILIDNEEFIYEVIEIEEEIRIINNQNFQQVFIKINLNEKYKYNNLFMETKIIISKEKTYRKIWNNIIERE